MVHSICFLTFFVQAFKIVVDSWTLSMLLQYILWDDWPIFMISASNEQLQQQLEYTLLKPECHSWWISKMQSEREDTLEERYAIEFCFQLGKNATEMYEMLQTAFWPSCMNRAWVFEWHKRFKESRESVRDDERCGRSKEVNTPELIGQRVRVRVIYIYIDFHMFRKFWFLHINYLTTRRITLGHLFLATPSSRNSVKSRYCFPRICLASKKCRFICNSVSILAWWFESY